MPTALVSLVREARRAGVQFDRAPNGSLLLRAPKLAAPLAKMLRAREEDVVKLYDWSHASVSESAPCVLCRQPAILRDPAEDRPCHKVCVDALLRPAQPGGGHD